MTTTDERVNRAYRTNRRDGMPAQYALSVARGAIAFDRMDWADDDESRLVRRNAVTYRVRVEFDTDAFEEYRSDELNDAGEPYPQWLVIVTTDDGVGLESCGGIGGGYWVGGWETGRGEPELDDATRAYLWWDFIEPAIRGDQATRLALMWDAVHA